MSIKPQIEAIIYAAEEPVTPRVRLSRMGAAAALALALCALLLGLVPWHRFLPVSQGLTSVPTLQGLWSSVWPILGGIALAILLGGRGERPAQVFPGKPVGATLSAARHAALIMSSGIERLDGGLRQWPIAGLCMLALAIAFVAAMLAGR